MGVITPESVMIFAAALLIGVPAFVALKLTMWQLEDLLMWLRNRG